MTLSRMFRAAPVLALLALACAGPCGAQADRKPAEDQRPSVTSPPQTVPEDTAPGRSGSSQEPLGKKLDETNGVLHPPRGVDPGLAIPPPRTHGTMPVIPPPGTPGGQPGVQPK